ncbi:hypothetical protein RB195_010469 [Necator americanus]|uniref:Uncharacterized protein n=1 Tax=Necator americanus TaxID=51031 RepID=A0ABR1CY63_NECAM
MSATASAYKALTTRCRNIVIDWLSKTKGLLEASESERVIARESSSESSRRDRVREIRLCLTACEENTIMLETTLDKFTKAYDDLEEHTDDEDKKMYEYVDNIHDTLVQLNERQSALKRVLQGLLEEQETPERMTDSNSLNPDIYPMGPLSVSKLPLIPIPNFSGKRWEWENFWGTIQGKCT